MGVNGLFKIRITKNKPKAKKSAAKIKGTVKSKVEPEAVLEIGDLGEKTSLKLQKGEKLCVDASITIYRAILALERIASLTDDQGKPTGHINTIFNQIIQMYEAGIEQIWIYDSPEPNPLKEKTLKDRAEKRKLAESKNQEKGAYRLNREHIEDIQTLMKFMGIMYIVAPPGVEAEQYGAYMTHGIEEQRFCKYMISADSDVLCFGGNLLRITTEKSDTGKTKKTVYKIYEFDNILRELDLTYEQFLQVCVHMGTDYCEGSEGVGPATVVDKVRGDKLYLSPRQELAIEEFKADISDRIGKAEIVQEEYRPDEVIKFLTARKFGEERVKQRLAKYKPADGISSKVLPSHLEVEGDDLVKSIPDDLEETPDTPKPVGASGESEESLNDLNIGMGPDTGKSELEIQTPELEDDLN